jgi:type II secretory pathway component GspD/PulD (secretin)
VLQCPKVTLLDGQEAVVRSTQRESFVTGLEATRVKGTVVLVPKNTPVETGTALTLCAKASADRRNASVRVNYADARVEGPVETVPVTAQVTPVFEGGSRGKPVPFTQYLQVPKIETLTIEKTDLTVPSGGHVLIPGPTRVQEVRQEFGPPVLSKVPYVNRMYKNVGVGRTAVRTYLIVSPLVLEVPLEPAAPR